MSQSAVRVYKAATTVVVLNQLGRHAQVTHVWRASATLEVVVAQGSAYVNGDRVESLGFALVPPGRRVELQGLEDGTIVLVVLQEDDLAPELRARFGGRTFAGRWRETLGLELGAMEAIDTEILAALIDQAVEEDQAYEKRVGLA